MVNDGDIIGGIRKGDIGQFESLFDPPILPWSITPEQY